MYDLGRAYTYISQSFDDTAVPALIEYIKIPNLSPAFNGGNVNEPETEIVVNMFVKWVESQNLKDSKVEVRRLPNRTPLILIDVPATNGYSGRDSILLYGHLDKQPPFEGWDEGTGPYTPVIKNGRLYGRGGADDGYAIFGSVLALKAIHDQGLPHARAVIMIEACEESGSPDLPAHLQQLTSSGILQDVSLVICLDSGAGNYDTLWITTSLRGLLMVKVKVASLTEGVHSGNGGGICSDTFRVFRQLLSSIEDERTGQIVPDFQVDIPNRTIAQNLKTCSMLGDNVWKGFPHVGDYPMNPERSNEDRALDRGWRASLTITGIDGLPPTSTGGNVIRPATTFKISMRLPPTYDHNKALDRLKYRFDGACPRDCRVEFLESMTAKGWSAPEIEMWLEDAFKKSSNILFQKEPCHAFEGGSIPFLGMLQDMFPQAQLYVESPTEYIIVPSCVTGVLGPHSNAHGPNEFLDLEYCKKIIACVSNIIAAHSARGYFGNRGDTGKLPDVSSAESRVGGAHEDKLVNMKAASHTTGTLASA